MLAIKLRLNGTVSDRARARPRLALASHASASELVAGAVDCSLMEQRLAQTAAACDFRVELNRPPALVTDRLVSLLRHEQRRDALIADNPSRYVDRVADRREAHLVGMPEVTDDYVAVMDPDADLEALVEGAREVVVEVVKASLHGERRAVGEHGRVLIALEANSAMMPSPMYLSI